MQLRDWQALKKNTLRRFAPVELLQTCLVIGDVSVHENNGQSWVSTRAGGNAQLIAAMREQARRAVVTGDPKIDPTLLLKGSMECTICHSPVGTASTSPAR